MVNAEPPWFPRRGDIVWLDFSPQSGHEQAGRRPALVLSEDNYNFTTGLCIACPITGRAKGYPFEVQVPTGLPVSGVVLSDHARNMDWRSRRAEWIGVLPADALLDVLKRVQALLGVKASTGSG